MVLVKDLKKIVYDDFEVTVEVDGKMEDVKDVVGFKIDKENQKIIFSVSRNIKFKED